MVDHDVVAVTPPDDAVTDDSIGRRDAARPSAADEEDAKSPACQLAATSAVEDVLAQLEEEILFPTDEEADTSAWSQDNEEEEDLAAEVDQDAEEDELLVVEAPAIPSSIHGRRRQSPTPTQQQCLHESSQILDEVDDEVVATDTQSQIVPASSSSSSPPPIVPSPTLEVAPPPESSSVTLPLAIDENLNDTTDEGFHEPSDSEVQDELDFALEIQRLRRGDGPLGLKRIRQGGTLSRPRIRRRIRDGSS